MGQLTGSIGFRGTYTDDFGVNPGISCGLGYALSDKSLLRAKAGYVVSVPTFRQLYQASHGTIDQVRGNPDLMSERSWSYELGMEHRFEKDRVLQINIFRSDTRNLISSLRGTDKINRPINIDWAWRHGFEVTLKWAWNARLSGDANFILQDSRSSETGSKLPYTPRVKAKATLQYAFASSGTRVEVTGRYEGARFSDAEGLPSQELHDYITFDAKLMQPFSVHSYTGEFFIKVENLLDRSFDVHYGYPDEGIRFNAGIQVRF
jgi:iron complex outermembrane receptor protein